MYTEQQKLKNSKKQAIILELGHLIQELCDIQNAKANKNFQDTSDAALSLTRSVIETRGLGYSTPIHRDHNDFTVMIELYITPIPPNHNDFTVMTDYILLRSPAVLDNVSSASIIRPKNHYEELKQFLLSAVLENDPNKASKHLQINQWLDLYGVEFLIFSSQTTMCFVKQVISSDDSWKIVKNIERVKLDVHAVGHKLLKATDQDFSPMQRYKIACLYCFKEDIEILWSDVSEELVSIRYSIPKLNLSDMIKYWTQYNIARYEDHLEFTENGFEAAVSSRTSTALEYFWSKRILELSEKEQAKLLIDTAIHYKNGCNNNIEVVDFVMQHLDKSKYNRLLKEDYKKNENFSTLNTLINNCSFDRAEELLKCLKPKHMTDNGYYNLIYSTLLSVLSAPADMQFVNAGYSMLSTLWHKRFESHKKYFTDSFDIDDIAIIKQLVDKCKVLDNVPETLELVINSMIVIHEQNLVEPNHVAALGVEQDTQLLSAQSCCVIL